MVAIEHRPKSSNATLLSPTSTTSSTSSSAVTLSSTATVAPNNNNSNNSNIVAVAPAATVAANTSTTTDTTTAPTTPNAPTTPTTNNTKKMSLNTSDTAKAADPSAAKSAVSQRSVDCLKISKKSHKDAAAQELSKKALKLDLMGKELDEYSIRSPKSPITARLPHQTSLTSAVDMEDRKTLREALYQGIFHRHRRTIFAVGSFLRMLRSRSSQYNTIRSSSEGEDIDEAR